MFILSPGAPGETEFWQARFHEVLHSDAHPMLKALAAVRIGKSPASYFESLSDSWRAFLLALERVQEGRPLDDIRLLLDEVDITEHPYISCMVPYLHGLLDWRAGIAAFDAVSRYKMDLSTDYGVALALELQAWHDHLREDFTRHLRGMFEASVAYLECTPSALFAGGRCLSIAANLAAEMCHHGIMAKCATLYESLQWSKEQERDRFNTLMGLSLWSLLIGQSDTAIGYARNAKTCEVPRCYVAHALLWTANIASYMDCHVWASDQVQTAAEMFDADPNADCPDRRSVLLSLALNYIPINAERARIYLTQYHLSESEVPAATSFDKRLTGIADITLARISRLNGEMGVASEVARRSYDILLKYGYVYRAGLAALETALASKGREREKWFVTARELLSRYSQNSDPYRYIVNAQASPAVHITEREGEILQGIKEGLTNPEIALRLHISRKTVEGAVSTILHKYGVKNRQELIHKITLRGMRQI